MPSFGLTGWIACAAGMVAAGLGVMTLLGWCVESPRLTAFGTHYMPMAPSTAILFIFYGTAICLRASLPQSHRLQWPGTLVVCFGMCVAIVLLLLNSTSIYCNVEHLGFNITGTVDNAPKGHMSPITAVCFILAGLAFLANSPRIAAWPWISTLALGGVSLLLMVCLIPLLIYTYGSLMLYGDRFIPPAVNTIAAFVALAIGLAALAARSFGESRAPEVGTKSLIVSMSVFLTLSLSIIAIGYIYFRYYEGHYCDTVRRQLAAIADLKVDELVMWRKERLADAAIFYNNAAFSALFRRCIEHPDIQANRTELKSWIVSVRNSVQYDEIVLHDAIHDDWIWFTDSKWPLSPTTIAKCHQTEQTGRLDFSDFYRNEYTRKVFLRLFVPIHSDLAGGKLIGALVLRIDPDTSLYQLIQRWPTPSETAEILLVRREGNEVVFLNELRFRKNTALNLRLPLTDSRVPAVKVALGETGNVHGIDYRGIPVLAAVRPVPDSPWSIVAKIDDKEVYATLRGHFWWTLTAMLLALAAAGMALAFIWRRRQFRFYREQWKAAQALRESEERFRTLVENIQDVVFAVNPDGTYAYVSPNVLDILGVPASEMIGTHYEQYVHPDDVPLCRASLAQSHQTMGGVPFEHRVLHRDGTVRWHSGKVAVIRGGDGNVTAHVGTVRDVTALRKSDEMLQMTRFCVEHVSDAMFLALPDARIVDVNEAACHSLGYTREELLHLSVMDIDTRFTEEVWRQHFEELRIHGSVRRESEQRTRDGKLFPVEIVANFIHYGGEECVCAFVRDISAQKQMADQMNEQLATLRRWKDATLDREDRVQELKCEVNEFCHRMGEPIRYPSQEGNSANFMVEEAVQ